MLNAILHGKAGNLGTGAADGKSWRSLYQDREDLLTATILERLTYLPSEIAWSLVCESAIPLHPLPKSLGELVEVRYWPRLPPLLQGGKYVEPDAILRFERGTLIAEAKRYDDPMQSAWQWAHEWAAFWSKSTNGPSGAGNSPDNVFLLALGGFAERKVRRLEQEARELLISHFASRHPELRAIPCHWLTLANNVYRHCRNAEQEGQNAGVRQILGDIARAFELHGYHPQLLLDDLASFARHISINGSLIGSGFLRRRSRPLEATWDAIGRLAPLNSAAEQTQLLWNRRVGRMSANRSP
jgi:hypothetical protein